MSTFCSIPGCQSQSDKATLFSSDCTSALSQWWKNTSWGVQAKQLGGAKGRKPLAQICIDHFEKDHIDNRRRVPCLKLNAVPTLKLPANKSSEESAKSPVPMYETESAESQLMNDNRNNLKMVCRFCSKTQKDPIKNQLENLVELEELLQLCLGRGRFLEGLPSGVCDLCFQTVKCAGAFIEDCMKAQEKLQEMFFGTSQQMADSFMEETQEQDKTFEHSFAVPEPVISLNCADELSMKYKLPDELDNNGSHDNDSGSDEENMNEYLEQDRYNGHHILSTTPKTKNQKRHREQESDIRCTECNRTFTDKTRLKEHVQSIHEKRRFTCEICGKIFNWSKSLGIHMRKIHNKAMERPMRKYDCKKCNKVFNGLDLYYSHEKTHKGDKTRCPLCNKSFKWEREYDMKLHFNRRHQEADMSEEIFIQKVIQNKSAARSELDQFRDHMRTHKDEKWLCPLCNKHFKWTREYDMKQHFNRMHQKTDLSEEDYVQQVVQCTFEAKSAA